MERSKKKAQKVLAKIASSLPQQQYQYLGKYAIKGENVKESGLKEPDDMNIDPEKEYVFKQVAYGQVNHKRRLVKVYMKEGKAGVYKYILPFIKPEKRNVVLRRVHSLPI